MRSHGNAGDQAGQAGEGRKEETMDKLTAVLAKYWNSDLVNIPEEKLQEVAEVLDAFMDDFRIVGWKGEDVGYGI